MIMLCLTSVPRYLGTYVRGCFFERTFIKGLHLFIHLPLQKEFLLKISEKSCSAMTVISVENVPPERKKSCNQPHQMKYFK